MTACVREVLALSSCFKQRPRIRCLPECSYSHSPTHLHLEPLLEVICASSIDALKLGCSLCSKGAYSLVLFSGQELNIHFSPGQRELCFKRDLLWAWVNLILRRFVGAQITAPWKQKWQDVSESLWTCKAHIVVYLWSMLQNGAFYTEKEGPRQVLEKTTSTQQPDSKIPISDTYKEGSYSSIIQMWQQSLQPLLLRHKITCSCQRNRKGW